MDVSLSHGLSLGCSLGCSASTAMEEHQVHPQAHAGLRSLKTRNGFFRAELLKTAEASYLVAHPT